MSRSSPLTSTPDGLVPVARSHVELIAGGLAAFLEGDLPRDTPLLSTIPIASFAGIALTMLPWLFSGGTLRLHHGFDPDVFAAQVRRTRDGAVVLPRPRLQPLAEAGLPHERESKRSLRLWRAPERLAAAKPWEGAVALVDVASFGEIGLLSPRAWRRPVAGADAARRSSLRRVAPPARQS